MWANLGRLVGFTGVALALSGCGAITLSSGSDGGGAGSGGTNGGTGGGSGGTTGSGGTVGSAGTTGSGGAGGSGGSPCRGLSPAQCMASPGCVLRMCPGCSGTGTSTYCFASTDPIACPSMVGCPINCEGLGEAACRAVPGCRVDTCPDCAGTQQFLRCSVLVGTPTLCPPSVCPAPPCADVQTLTACEARVDCHSVFEDPRTCGCAALGCCARFSRCASGNTAICRSPPILCDAATPYCEGPYVVAYTANCYEGCVLQKDCPP